MQFKDMYTITGKDLHCERLSYILPLSRIYVYDLVSVRLSTHVHCQRSVDRMVQYIVFLEWFHENWAGKDNK